MCRHSIDLHPITVKNLIRLSPDSYLLSFERNFEFSAGQVLGIALKADDEPRLYSIASGEKDNDVEILFNVKPGGELTPKLSELKTGDTIFVTLPFGSFHDSDKPAFFIATGTGIAPFRSMIRSGVKHEITLVHGSRIPENFYFDGELIAANINYVKCLSKGESTGVFKGRVTDYLKSIEILPAEHNYHICGNAEMVLECRDFLLEKNIPFGNIIAEIYF